MPVINPRLRSRLKPWLISSKKLLELGRKRVLELYVDESATRQRAGAGIVLFSPEKAQLKFAVRFEFPASNNET